MRYLSDATRATFCDTWQAGNPGLASHGVWWDRFGGTPETLHVQEAFSFFEGNFFRAAGTARTRVIKTDAAQRRAHASRGPFQLPAMAITWPSTRAVSNPTSL